MMTVGELKAILAQYDDDDKVLFLSQPHWPLEHQVAGVARRSDFDDEPADKRSSDSGSPSDVILVEGRWERYGKDDAWKVAQRRPG